MTFNAVLNDDRTEGTVNLDLPDAPLPVLLHLHGSEQCEQWESGSDDSRMFTAQKVVMDLLTFRILSGLKWQEAIDVYNEGVPDKSHSFSLKTDLDFDPDAPPSGL